MDDVAVDRIKDFQAKMADYLTSRKSELMSRIAKEKALSDPIIADLKATLTEFKQTYK
jgi:F-type H+/Na+-transporting ATPase subunit alpha